MILVRLILRFVLVPIGGCFASLVAAMVVCIAHWTKFSALVAADPQAPENFVLAVLFIGPALALIMSIGAFAMLMPATIGVLISEAFAIRSWIYHVANGALASWIGWLAMYDFLKPYEFYDEPSIAVSAGIAAGFAYWMVAGWNAGFLEARLLTAPIAAADGRTRLKPPFHTGTRRLDETVMNRTGLFITLAIAALVGLVFGFYPELDLNISSQFFDPAKKDFMLRWNPLLIFLRDAAMWVVSVIAAPAFIALAIKMLRPRGKLLIAGRALVFLIATLALAPGLVTNVVLKDYWPRSRPIDVPQFNGEERFSAWWDPRGGCPKNCSFIGGEASGAFWTLAPAALSPPAWRPLAYGAALLFAVSVSALRLAFGAHFFSDVVFSGVFTFLLIWLAYALIYRWRPTRFSDAAVERLIERIALPPHDAVIAIFSAATARLFRRGKP